MTQFEVRKLAKYFTNDFYLKISQNIPPVAFQAARSA